MTVISNDHLGMYEELGTNFRIVCVKNLTVPDEVHLSQNEAYAPEHPAQLQSADNAASVSIATTEMEMHPNPTGYDQTQNSAHTSHVTTVSMEEILEHSTDAAAQYCEMHEARHGRGSNHLSRLYEVPATNWRGSTQYSHLIHECKLSVWTVSVSNSSDFLCIRY